MKQVLVTGANGFVGSSLCRRLSTLSYDVIGAVRHAGPKLHTDLKYLSVGAIDHKTDWSIALQGIDIVVHTAGRAHIFKQSTANSREEFLKVNLHATTNLARQSIRAGVKRFIFISSIGVNGITTKSKPFSEVDTPNPQSDYAYSKLCAELELKKLCENEKIELVIIRPPLIYSVDAPGNFNKLLNILKKGYPLPFLASKNKRSLLYLDNFIDFLLCVMEHPLAANELFLISDEQVVSTKSLIKFLNFGMVKSVRLFYCPDVVLRTILFLIGRYGMYQQLCCSLEIDNSKIKTMLDWRPPFSTKDALIDVGRSLSNR